MSDERQAFEQLHAIPSGAIWCENRDVYIHKNYSGLVLHPINESWEAFCEGALWQASRQDFECEPVAEVAQVGGTPVVFWDKSLTVGTKLYTRTASRHALSSCSEIPNSSGHACRQAVSVPDAWCVVTNDDQIQYTAMVDKNLGLPIEQSHDYAWQQCNEVIQEWIELGLDAASKYVIRPIALLATPTKADDWIKCSDRLPNLGQRVILKSRGVVQNYMPVFDQGDDDRGMGDHFWDFEDVNKIDNPLVDFEKDCWMPKPQQEQGE